MAVVLLLEAVPKRYAMGAVLIPTATAIVKRSIGTSLRKATERSVWTYNAYAKFLALSGSSTRYANLERGFTLRSMKCRFQDVAAPSK